MMNNKVDAGPTREFIINTITKDIRIQAAIFDLIDNSINAAETITKFKNLRGCYISLKINKREIEISDNCGGIPKNKAIGDAFKIGNSIKNTDGYGIGLKRAFLKFGRNINIYSNRNDYSFIVKIDVNKWGTRNNWGIKIIESKYNNSLDEGFSINVSNLYDEIIRNFSSKFFINNLKKEISMRYRYKLKTGFEIIVNGEGIKEAVIEGDKVAESPYKVMNGMIIKIILYNNVNTILNGWDIIINGRVVVERDKTKKTLWRKKLITKGCSYQKFVGEVIIEGDNIKKLPILSTKDEVDTNSKAYEDILIYMYDVVEKHRGDFIKPEINIQYSKPSYLVDTLKKCFDTSSAKEVGEFSFDYTYNNKEKIKD